MILIVIPALPGVSAGTDGQERAAEWLLPLKWCSPTVYLAWYDVCERAS